MIDTGADMDPITARAPLPVRRAGRERARRPPADRAPRRIVLFRNALREAAELRRYRVARLVARAASRRDDPVVRNPNESRLTGPNAQRSDDVLLTRFDAAALVPVLQGRQYLLVHVERASDILQVLALKREFPALKMVLVGATEGWTVADRIAASGVPVIASAVNDLPAQLRAAGRDPVERRPDARRRGQGRDRHDRRQ